MYTDTLFSNIDSTKSLTVVLRAKFYAMAKISMTCCAHYSNLCVFFDVPTEALDFSPFSMISHANETWHTFSTK